MKTITCRIAGWSLKHVIPLHGKKISATAIKRAIAHMKAEGTITLLEFNDAVTGQCFNIWEAAQQGATYLHVRYNEDRDVAVVKL